jgi:hypothetical protein
MSGPVRKDLLDQKAVREALIKAASQRIESLRIQAMSTDFAASWTPHVPSAEEVSLLARQRDLRMQVSSLDLQIREDYDRIGRLRFWVRVLTLGGSIPSLLTVGIAFVAFGLLIPLLWLDIFLILLGVALVPVVFVPLWRTGRPGWLVALAITVASPMFLRFIPHHVDGNTGWTFTVIVVFVFLCGVLSHAIDDWVDL